jgi:hypothetical protein
VTEDAEQDPTPRLRWLLERMWQESKQVELDIETMSDELDRISEQNELCRRLRKILASAPWSRPPLWPPSEREPPSDPGVTLQPGCRATTALHRR